PGGAPCRGRLRPHAAAGVDDEAAAEQAAAGAAAAREAGARERAARGAAQRARGRLTVERYAETARSWLCWPEARRHGAGLRRLRMLNVGTAAPDFELPDQDGRRHRLSDKRGSWVVLYFYPKDDTPGCTKEACAFRDAMADLGDLDAEVFGVSADDTASHAEFAAKYGLNFPLLADVDREVIDAYQAWGEKERDGVRYEGIMRITYLIDPQGMIAQTWTVEEPEAHADEDREALSRPAGRVSAGGPSERLGTTERARRRDARALSLGVEAGRGRRSRPRGEARL